jgi:uncharacterized protein (DUF2141 family)
LALQWVVPSNWTFPKKKELTLMDISSRPLRVALSATIFIAALALSTPNTAAQAQPAPGAAPQAAPAQSTSSLTVKIKGIRNAKGKIAVVLYGDEKGFPLDPSNAVAAKQVDIDPQTLTATVVFDKLPQGVYAATVLHDENMVGKMEFDPQGTPLEGYGISNNPDSSQGPPTFNDSKFAVNQSEAAIEIAMVYWQ